MRKGEMKPYPFKNCPHCAQKIGKFTKTGKPIQASHYLGLKTCGKSLCVKKEKGQIVPLQSPVTDSPMDWFLYGMAA